MKRAGLCTVLPECSVEFTLCPVPHGRKSWNTPWTSLVCFLIFSQPDPSYVVSIIEEPLGKWKQSTHLHCT